MIKIINKLISQPMHRLQSLKGEEPVSAWVGSVDYRSHGLYSSAQYSDEPLVQPGGRSLDCPQEPAASSENICFFFNHTKTHNRCSMHKKLQSIAARWAWTPIVRLWLRSGRFGLRGQVGGNSYMNWVICSEKGMGMLMQK